MRVLTQFRFRYVASDHGCRSYSVFADGSEEVLHGDDAIATLDAVRTVIEQAQIEAEAAAGPEAQADGAGPTDAPADATAAEQVTTKRSRKSK